MPTATVELGVSELDEALVRLLRDEMEVLVRYLAFARDADDDSDSYHP
jgi:hypothetical protein